MQPVTELDNESGRLLEMVGQQVLVGVTSLSSKNTKVRDESKDLVERTLESIAPTLYRGMSIATVDHSRISNIMQMLGLTEIDLPVIYVTDATT